MVEVDRKLEFVVDGGEPLEMVEVDRKLEFVVDGGDADLALSADREKNGVGGAVQASHCMLVAGRA